MFFSSIAKRFSSILKSIVYQGMHLLTNSKSLRKSIVPYDQTGYEMQQHGIIQVIIRWRAIGIYNGANSPNGFLMPQLGLIFTVFLPSESY